MMSREQLIDFCVFATAELEGMEKEEVFRGQFESMSDNELIKEFNWLNDMLDK